jgi:hypothetical protein
MFGLIIIWFTTESGFEWNYWGYSILVRVGFDSGLRNFAPGIHYVSIGMLLTGAFVIVTSFTGRLRPLSRSLLPMSVFTFAAGVGSVLYAYGYFKNVELVEEAGKVIVELGWGAYTMFIVATLNLAAGIFSRFAKETVRE